MTTFCYPYKRGTGWRSQAFRSNPGGFNPSGGHTGYDQAMPAGTPIYAPGDGIIRLSSWVSDNYLANDWWLTRYGGDMLVLDCTDAFGRSETMPTFIFAHLSESIAEVGQRVKKGQLIGKSGNSGTATSGPHCHIEALPPNWDFQNGVYGRVDPELYFSEWPEDIRPASGSITPITEEELSAQEADRIIKEVNGYTAALLLYGYQSGGQKHPGIADQIEGIPDKTWSQTVLRGGQRISVKQELADAKSEAQALRAAVVALAKNPDLTAEQITAAVKAGLADGTVTVDVNINQGK
ncbi:endolysin [Arthrobacter phage Sicarius2]|uniref:Endolysin n=1 Tax=Arthrobacter phage Sicarius2 TaxID=2836090 RepID=A0A8F3EA44_9CAUD|nr:endolysin [Arthrobacter phage Sicarius2]